MTNHEHITDRDFVCNDVGIIGSKEGWAIPGKFMRLARFTPDTENGANVITVTHWLKEGRGIYTILTPEGARKVGETLIAMAARAEQRNEQMAMEAINRALKGDGK